MRDRIFVCYNDVIMLEMDVFQTCIYKIIYKGISDELESFFVPKNVKSHQGITLYRFSNLKEIIAHPESPYYETHDGCLYTKQGELLYVPRGKTHLHIDACTKSFDPDIFYDHPNLEKIDTSDNDRYVFRDGCLFDKEMTRLYFVSSRVTALFIPASVYQFSCGVFNHAYDTIRIEEGSPYFEVQDGVLTRGLGLEGREILYVTPGVEALELTDYFKVAPRALQHNCAVSQISFRYDADSLAKLENSFSREKRIRYTARFENQNTLTFTPYPLSVSRYLRIFFGEDVDVRKGTEAVYLDKYFAGRISSPTQKHNFCLSVMQILKYLIDMNDTERMEKVLSDNRLVTKRNRHRLVRYAEEMGRSGMVTMLSGLQQLPEKIAF